MDSHYDRSCLLLVCDLAHSFSLISQPAHQTASLQIDNEKLADSSSLGLEVIERSWLLYYKRFILFIAFYFSSFCYIWEARKSLSFCLIFPHSRREKFDLLSCLSIAISIKSSFFILARPSTIGASNLCLFSSKAVSTAWLADLLFFSPRSFTWRTPSAAGPWWPTSCRERKTHCTTAPPRPWLPACTTRSTTLTSTSKMYLKTGETQWLSIEPLTNIAKWT